MIYIIGDSHVSVFSGTDKTHDGKRHIQPEFGTCYTVKKGSLRSVHNKFEQKIPFFCPIKIGSHTAYNSLKRLPIILQALDEYKVSTKDYVFLCFGEIDIRNHIGENAEANNVSIQKSVQLCVDRYIKTAEAVKKRLYKTGVYGAPASSVGWPETYGYKDIVTRNKITLEFNKQLKVKCQEKNILYTDIAKEMMLPSGETNPKYIMDDIHLSQEAMPLLIDAFMPFING